MIGKKLFLVTNHVCIGAGDNAGQFVWRKTSEKFNEDCLNFKKKYPESYMVWSCMTAQGVGKLCILYVTINSEIYMQVLEEFLIPSIESWFLDSNDFHFQQDNASCHRSKIVQKYLKNNRIKTIKWPANSPDLSPIENLWATWKQLIRIKKT